MDGVLHCRPTGTTPRALRATISLVTIRTKPDAPVSPTPSRAPEAPKPATNEVAAQRTGLRRWEVRDVPSRLTGATGFDTGTSRAQTVAPQAQVRVPVPGTYPSGADIDRIVAVQDPVERNYQITQGYHDVSNAVSELLGKENANWATFGVWASRQAGSTIRKEDTPAFLNKILESHEGVTRALDTVNKALGSVGLPTIPNVGQLLGRGDALMDSLSGAIADGNREVFDEIAREFSTFVDTFKGDTQYNQAKVDQYLSHFKPEQAGLRDAFANYAKAQFEKDPNKKAELMLLANDQVGLHEQTRLQTHVARALDAPGGMIRELIKDGIEAVASKAGPFGSGRFLFKALEKTGVLDKALDPLVNVLGDGFRRAATELMMKLALPNGQDLKLGQDLPGPLGGPSFSRDLERIENSELRKILSQLDRSPDSLQGSGASDWRSLGDRMNYITDLFRSYQQDPSLWNPPLPGRSGNYARPAPRVS